MLSLVPQHGQTPVTKLEKISLFPEQKGSQIQTSTTSNIVTFCPTFCRSGRKVILCMYSHKLYPRESKHLVKSIYTTQEAQLLHQFSFSHRRV